MNLFKALNGKGAVAESTPAKKEKKKRRRWHWPRITIDLSRARDRRNLFLASLVGLGLLVGFLFAGFKVVAYSESAEFCGTTCHPMQSVYTRYEASPHANVSCAECHIGAGVEYFLRAKVDGMKSLYYAITDTYEKPIKSPVENLRPARETCEECHTPTAFKDNIIKLILHHDDDEANTPVQSTLILKMGGWKDSSEGSEGIHWHIKNPVYYIPADEQRQVILWIGAEQEDGTLKEYYARDMLTMAQTSFVEEARANGEIRQMDCIDCHNRAAHLIPPPDVMVDRAISDGRISATLPYIRAKGVEVLSAKYESTEEAHAAIDGLAEFYRTNYPQVYNNDRATLNAALYELKKIFDETTFPDMNLDWQANPNNERHSPFPGCFRCHDGKHARVDPEGKEVEVVSVKCNLCHTVPIVGRGSDMLIEAPVVVGRVPDSHADFRYTIEHRTTTPAEREECYQCHGKGFCQNEACHSLRHPPDMLYTHADEYRRTGDQICYNCHQDVLCSRCHPGGIVANP